MQRLKNSVLSLTVAILVFSSTTSSQMQEPLATSRPEQQQGSLTPASKFLKAKNPMANRYIVVLNDDVVSDNEPLEVGVHELLPSPTVMHKLTVEGFASSMKPR